MVRKMKREKFERKIRLLFIIGAVVAIVFPIFIYLLYRHLFAALCSFIGLGFMLVLMEILHRSDDKYISDIVSGLSDLIDTLTELDEKEIFPDNEDIMVSKLQNKVIKLVHILKRNQKRTLHSTENIKSLVSDISHQLKTPISNLKMYSNFLTDEHLTSKQRKEYVNILCQSVQRLNFLTEGMIKISRLESGVIRLNMQQQSLNETVLQAVKDIYAKAKAKETEIIYAEEKNISIKHDRNWTAEGIFNLLDNAVKYSKRGSKIYLTVKSYGMFAMVEVKDENPPIPENERNKLFTRFYRGSNSSGKEGIGIGLHLVREIAIRQGGYVKLNSNKSGNQFTVVLGNQS